MVLNRVSSVINVDAIGTPKVMQYQIQKEKLYWEFEEICISKAQNTTTLQLAYYITCLLVTLTIIWIFIQFILFFDVVYHDYSTIFIEYFMVYHKMTSIEFLSILIIKKIKKKQNTVDELANVIKRDNLE